MQRFEIASSESGTTLRQILSRQFPTYSARALRRHIEGGRVRVNQKVQLLANVSLIGGDLIEIALDLEGTLIRVDSSRPSLDRFKVSVNILEEQERFFAVDKPAGLSSEEVLRCRSLRNCLLIHRLDRDTSGVLLLAKNRESYYQGVSVFRKGQVRKHYLALVEGQVRPASGRIEVPLSLSSQLPGKAVWKCAKRSDKLGNRDKTKAALTHWSRLTANCRASLLYCRPVTGRTHQVRLHLAHLGHSILGDRDYGLLGGLVFSRQMLHARRLQIPPCNLDIAAPIPEDFAVALERLQLPLDLNQLVPLECRDDTLSLE